MKTIYFASGKGITDGVGPTLKKVIDRAISINLKLLKCG